MIEMRGLKLASVFYAITGEMPVITSHKGQDCSFFFKDEANAGCDIVSKWAARDIYCNAHKLLSAYTLLRKMALDCRGRPVSTRYTVARCRPGDEVRG